MRAARIHRYGGPEVIQLDDVPVPEVGPGQVRIAVHAASVNPVDAKLRAGSHRAVVRWRLPHTLGLDVSGVVDAVGPGVDGFAVGDAVFASPNHDVEGTCADRVVVPAVQVARAPRSIPLADAAALPLVALTAWACLVDTARVQPGERVLVLNGSGGVGTVAIQIAAALGAEVSATCSPRNEALVRALGAQHVVDYRTEDPADRLPPQDVVLVGIGGTGVDQALRASAPGARITTIVGDIPTHVARWGPWLGVARAGLGMAGQSVRGRLRGRRVSHVVRSPDGAALAEIAAWVDAGRLRPVIDARYPLEALADAHRAIEAGHVAGKLLIEVGQG